MTRDILISSASFFKGNCVVKAASPYTGSEIPEIISLYLSCLGFFNQDVLKPIDRLFHSLDIQVVAVT